MRWRSYSETLFEKLKLSMSLDQQSEVSYGFVFIACLSRGLLKHIETKVLTTFTSYKAFLKNKKKSGSSLLASYTV